MNVKKGSMRWPGMATLAAAVLTTCYISPARADELIARHATVSQPVGVPLGLDHYLAPPPTAGGFQVRDDLRSDRVGLRTAADWEHYLRQHASVGDEATREMLEQAVALALEMVVISYNGQTSTTTTTNTTSTTTTATTVVSSEYQTWQWKAGSWSLPPPPQLPPGKTEPPLSNVPEPASLVSALLGTGLAGWGVWRRRRRQVNTGPAIAD